ncbi:MAG TPA: hypothetical protein VKR54_01550 [Candidatus Babeliales bacterium]|jgi:hypothetical protein|nr:hypothetical protein [Candidatus Babeliales bacterium]
MNYLKTFFITTILLNMGTIFNGQEPIAPTSAPHINFEELFKSTEPVASESTLITAAPTAPEEPVQAQTESQEWDKHLATLAASWDATNNIPNADWKTQAFDIAERMVTKDKSSAETVKSSFLAAINKQSTQITQALLDLINEFNKAIEAKVSALEPAASQENKETPPAQASTIPEPTPEPVPTPSAPAPETFPAPASLAETTSTTTEAVTSNPEQQANDQLQKQWDDQLAKIKEGQGNEFEIDAMLNKAHELAVQLKNKKTIPALQKEFNAALDILGVKKKLPQSELAYRMDAFNRALSPEQYQQAYQQQQTVTEQEMQKQKEAAIKTQEKKIEDERVAREKKQKETTMLQKAAIARLEEEGKINKAQAHELDIKVTAMQQKLALAEAERQAAEQKARTGFTTAIKQPTPTAKKLAEEQKAAAEQGILGKAIKAVKSVTEVASNWWYGSSASPTQTQIILSELELADQQEFKNLQIYLDATSKDTNEKNKIKELWQNLQQILRVTPQVLDKKNIEFNRQWINDLEQTLAHLIITHPTISIDDACAKIQNVLSLFPSTEGPDYSTQIVQTIKAFLEKIVWQEAHTKQQEEASRLQVKQQRREHKEKIMLAQQKIKNEEDRIEAEKKKQLRAAADYKNEKKQWNQLLAQISQNVQATAEENDAHTLEAIKKSHSLLALAHIIPAKNKHSVSQKLKQKFTVALLDQQKLNENKINIHKNMDQFNKEMNRAIE